MGPDLKIGLKQKNEYNMCLSADLRAVAGQTVHAETLAQFQTLAIILSTQFIVVTIAGTIVATHANQPGGIPTFLSAPHSASLLTSISLCFRDFRLKTAKQ